MSATLTSELCWLASDLLQKEPPHRSSHDTIELVIVDWLEQYLIFNHPQRQGINEGNEVPTSSSPQIPISDSRLDDNKI